MSSLSILNLGVARIVDLNARARATTRCFKAARHALRLKVTVPSHDVALADVSQDVRKDAF